MNILTLQIASLPDKNNIVAEIWLGSDQIAEVSCEDGAATNIEIFPAPNGGAWFFDLVAFEKILNEAKINLRNA